MSRKRALIFIGVVCVVAGVLYCLSSAKRPQSVSVSFVCLTNNPVATFSSPIGRVAVAMGATNLCAVFWFTNAGAASVWFTTDCAERKVDGKWVECARPSGQWNGLEGGMWTKGSGCLYAVGWPPGLPANATWRLQIRCGNDLSAFKSIINQKFGAVFGPSKSFGIFPSGEVVP
jgi:hypothetical protein